MHETNPSPVERSRPTPRLPNPGRLEGERMPWWMLPALILWIVLVVTMLVVLGALDERPDDMPADIPANPSPSSRPWSEDCTAEELNTGVCYLTWDHIRNQPTYTQSP